MSQALPSAAAQAVDLPAAPVARKPGAKTDNDAVRKLCHEQAPRR